MTQTILLTFLAAMAALGVLSGSTLSYPVGLLAVVVMVLMALGHSIFTEAVREFTGVLGHHHGEAPPELIPLALRQVWQKVMLVVLEALPTLGGVDPGSALAEGRSIPLGSVGRAFLEGTLLRGGCAFFIAWVLFRRQELAKRR